MLKDGNPYKELPSETVGCKLKVSDVHAILHSVTSFIKEHWVVLLLGTIIRLAFAPFTGHPYDMPIWIQSGYLLNKGLSPYGPTYHLGQTIVWAIWTAIAYRISFLLPFGHLHFYILFIKLPCILSDVLCSYFLAAILQEEGSELSTRSKQLLVSLVYLNPVFIFASAFWAMVDSSALLLLLLAYRDIRDARWVRSSAWLTLAISIKLYPVVLVPAYMLYLILYRNQLKLSMIYGTLTATLFFIIAYLPFLLFHWDSTQITGVLQSQSTRDVGGMSPLGFFAAGLDNPAIKPDVTGLLSFFGNYALFHYLWVIDAILLFLLIFFLSKQKRLLLPKDRLLGFLLLICIFYLMWILAAFWVSEQNFIPLLGMLELLSFRMHGKESRRLIILQGSLSVIVTIYLMFNVPVNRFFYMVNPSVNQIFANRSFVIFRSMMMMSLIMVVTIINMLVIRQLLQIWKKEANNQSAASAA